MTPTLNLDDADIPRLSPGGDRRSQQGLSTKAAIGILTAFISIVGFAFTAGVEWNKVSEVGARQEKWEQTSEERYVRKDVAEQQARIVFSKLDEINARLAELQQRTR